MNILVTRVARRRGNGVGAGTGSGRDRRANRAARVSVAARRAEGSPRLQGGPGRRGRLSRRDYRAGDAREQPPGAAARRYPRLLADQRAAPDRGELSDPQRTPGGDRVRRRIGALRSGRLLGGHQFYRRYRTINTHAYTNPEELIGAPQNPRRVSVGFSLRIR